VSQWARAAVISLTALIIGYASWLLLVGISVEVAYSSGARAVERRWVPAAVIPLVMGLLVLVGSARGSMASIWAGAIGILTYGTLAIFGMGVYMPILGLLLVLAQIWHSIALRGETGSRSPPVGSSG